MIIICLTGTSRQFCSGINDANKGVQLLYLNNDSAEWIQIAYFYDTIYFAVSKIIIYVDISSSYCLDNLILTI